MSEENNDQIQENENNEENAENKPEEEIQNNLVKEETVEKEGEELGEAKEEPANEIVAENEEEPKEETLEEKKDEEPKEEVQEEPKEEAQEEPKEEAQEEQKLEVQEEPQEEPKEEAQEEPKEEDQEEPKEEVQEEPKEEPQEEPKEENEEEQQEEPKEENEEEPKEENEEEPKEEPQEENSEESKEEPKEEYKEVDIYTREETKEEPRKLYDRQETKEEPKEEEADKEDKSDSEQKEVEIPTEIILFSTLSKEDKIKYFNFFIANDTQFIHEPQGTWLAEIDIFDDDKPEEAEEVSSKQKDIKNLRQSAFRSTKKDYDTIYSKLINVINPSPGIKGKKVDINAIKYMIQEIYSLKFLKDTQALFSKEDSEPESFPVFVGNFLINKFPKKDILNKKAVDFMLSLDFYGLKHKEIKIFQQFVTEEYDAEDLIFYLFVRSCIEKELKVFFLEKAKENLGQGLLYGQEDDDIMVPVKKCDKLAKAIFGTEDKDLLKTFMSNIKKLAETDAADEKKKHLKANAILNMALENYHDSRGKVDEADEDQENDSEDGKKKKKKDKKKKDKGKEKDKEKDKDKDKKKQKKKKEEEVKKEKKDKKEALKKKAPKRKVESSEDEKEENYGDSDENNEEEEEEEERITRKQPTKLRAQKKGNLKSYGTSSKPKAGSATKTKTKTSTLNTASKPGKGGKVTTTIKVVTNKTASKPSTKINAPTKSTTSSRMNTSGNKNKSARKASKEPREAREPREVRETREAREPRGESKKKRVQTSSMGKRKQTSSVGRRPASGLYSSDNYEQTQDFKKILNRNRIDKVKTESDKINCLLYIISDYFKQKEIDAYFKEIIDSNPIFQSYAPKINTHIKNTKEFTLKKLSGICKYVAAGDKTGYYNFMRIKDKNGKGNYETLKSTFNSLLKSGPLKHLNENDIKEYCKMILDIPELSVQTSKSLLKHCE